MVVSAVVILGHLKANIKNAYGISSTHVILLLWKTGARANGLKQREKCRSAYKNEKEML